MAEPRIPTTLAEWLDDLTVRFLLNLPSSELSSVPRLCFQVEEAQWFYEDFVRPAVAASGALPLPSLPLRQFFLMLFQHCPLLSGFTDTQHIAAYEDFLAYKVRIPVRGAILLDQSMEKVLLVRGWKKSASWSFPRGKINKDEKDLDCAIREAYEETGYDAREAGLIPENEDEVRHIDITMREQHLRLFIFRGVSEQFHFEPRTRKEIGKIEWYNIRDLPGFKRQKNQGDATQANKFYMVAPFLGQLKKYIGQQRKQDAARASQRLPGNGMQPALGTDDDFGTDTPGGSVALKSEELRKLLSIGGPASPSVAVDAPPQSDPHMNKLMAMLHGGAAIANGSSIPKTPFEQITGFPPEPETPHPQHARHPVTGAGQGAPPQFPISPPHTQLSHQDQASMLMPNLSTQVNAAFQPASAGTAGYIPQKPIYQQQHPPPHLSNAANPPDNRFGFDTQTQPPMPQNQLPQRNDPRHIPWSPTTGEPQYVQIGPSGQGALGGGQAIPSASQIPAPKLSAHSMRLLDSFKTGERSSAQQAPPSHGSKPSSGHQANLLNLFKQRQHSEPSAVQQISEPPQPENVASLPSTIAPSKSGPKLERKTTLNEFTRTLPARKHQPKSRAPVQSPNEINQASIAPQSVEATTSKRLFDPSRPAPSPRRTSAGLPREDSDVLAAPVKILQSPRSNAKPSSPDQARPTITILPRPGSSKGSMSPSTSHTLRPQGQNLSPQLPVLTPPFVNDIPSRGHRSPEESSTDKRDHLLALFGKPAGPTQTTVPTQGADRVPSSLRKSSSPVASETTPTPTGDRQTNLLSLFNSPPPSARQPISAPPPAPKIVPERRPSHVPAKTSSTPQSLLLDLLQRPTITTGGTISSSPPATTSPGTPISPFTLGTPITRGDHVRSRLGSVASVSSSAGDTTPKEAKEFLVGFLNGVVRNEGGMGSRRG